jgi:hypothetical protein
MKTVERDPCGGLFLREPAKGLTVIGDGAFVDDFTARIERTDGMLGVAEIEPAGGGWNEVVHGNADSSAALKRRPLPSHLILLALLIKFFDVTWHVDQFWILEHPRFKFSIHPWHVDSRYCIERHR